MSAAALPRDLGLGRAARPGARRALRRLPGLRDERALPRAVRERVQPAPRLHRAPLLRPRRVLRLGGLRDRARREGLGLPPGAGGRDRGGGRHRPGRGRGQPRDPPVRDLLRHDHAGLRPARLLPRRADGVDRGRGRAPGRPPREGARGAPARPPAGHVLLRVRGVPRGLLHHPPGDPLALRARAARGPRERAARALARLRRGSLQARGVRALRRPVGPRRLAEGAREPVRVALRRPLAVSRARWSS